MTPIPLSDLQYFLVHVIFLEFLIIANLILIQVALSVNAAMYPSPEVIYYFQNCNNLTLFPDGCQVMT